MSENGRIAENELTTVAVGVQLIHTAANAYRALIAQGAHEHIAIKPAPGVGSGYRSFAVQELFKKAEQGDTAAAKAVQLNSDSIIRVASPGYSSHGTGDRIDLLFDGSSNPTAVDLNLAKRFGWTREFGSADPNHFEHDGKTAIHPPTTAPAAAHEYVIARDKENLSLIAERHQLSLSRIEMLNPQIHDFNLIHPGDKIRVK